MTKAELLKEFDKLQKEKEIRIEGIHCNSNKSTIENAIECLKCPDELLEKYLTVVSLKYENIGRTIAENGDFQAPLLQQALYIQYSKTDFSKLTRLTFPGFDSPGKY